MTTKPPALTPNDPTPPGPTSAVPSELARRQHEFEQLLALQAQRRQREDTARLDEQKIEVREESLVQEAYRLSMAKASFHAEKISWKRAMEDQLRQEEDTRRAMEDARRTIEDERRKREDLVQTELDADVKLCYERNTAAERKQLERKRRWIEEDRVRALEDALISQDVLDLHVHASLRQHIKKHFNEIIGLRDATKEQIEIQIDALLDRLFDSEPQGPSSANARNTDGSLSTSSSTASIEHSSANDAPPSYKDVTSSSSSPVGPIEAHIPRAPLSVNDRSVASVPIQEPSPQVVSRPAVTPREKEPRSALTRKSSPHSTEHIEVDDFAVLEDEDERPKKPRSAQNTPSRQLQPSSAKSTSSNTPNAAARQKELSSPMSSSMTSPSPQSKVEVPNGPQKPTIATIASMDLDDDPDFAFDMSIQPERPLGSQEDWEVVAGRETGAGASNNNGGQNVQLEGASKDLSEFFRKTRGESMEALIPLRQRQMTRMLSEPALKALLDPSFTDLNPFSKLVISTRDTWASCEQCGTFFDRMSIKQTCGTCNRSFCSKCGLVSRKLDLTLLTSRVPASAQEIRAIFPKNKEDYSIEVKCCTSCDKTLAFIEANDARVNDQRSSFFQRQYQKAVSAKIAVAQAVSQLDDASKSAKKPNPSQLHELESNILSSMRKLQSCMDSIDQTVNTLRAELPIHPKTQEKLTSSTEIRTLLALKTTLMNFLVECKQSHTQLKIKLVGPAATTEKLTLDNFQPGHPSHRK